ncbi:MAG: PssE/Cps14G family polysaccharide biosynthesis glycosyltransferase [Methanobacteriaceae archaeon]|nr:PssE/Cps14G family polysaccharide biosynthesis glycosyltransferase [Methanobacteriaceae archaeon]
MIFVTVGTHNQGFERLIKKMDEIAPNLDDEVIMQIGYTDYNPKNVEWFKFLEYNDINNLYDKADLIVSHAGAGTLLDSLNYQKPIIVVPRLKKFGEIIDDQQLELAEALGKRNRVISINDIADLERCINQINNFDLKSLKRDRNLKSFLSDSLRGNSK